MKSRIFLLLSLVSVAVALCAQVGALRQLTRRAIFRAKAVNVVEEQRPALRLEADKLGRIARVLHIAGLVLAASSVAFLIASHRRREPARRSVAVILLVFYCMSLLLLV